MKKTNWVLFVIATLAVGMIPGIVGAQAVVIKDTSIVILDTAYNPYEVFNTVKVMTPSQNCNVNVSSHGVLGDWYPEPLPTKAVILDYDVIPVPCIVNFDGIEVRTNDWHEVITPSGRVNLSCHFKCDQGPQDPL